MTAGALTNGYGTDTQLNCSSSLHVGNRDFKNYESGAYGYITFAKALEVSCNTFFYRVGYDFWQRFGSDVADVDAKDPLVAEAKEFGFGRETGIDLPGEASGRIADRKWKRAYFESQKDYYCDLAGKPQDAKTSDFVYLFAREFCVEGYAYRAGDAVNFAIGQGDTIVTPLQLARGYAAIANGGTLYAPRIGKAIVAPDGTVIRHIAPKKVGKVDVPDRVIGYIDEALKGVTRQGTMAWKMGGFPLDQVVIRSKTGSAEVYGKQSTSWVASYSDDYVVVMMVSQGGTGSGTSGPGIRAIWESLYGIERRAGRARPRRDPRHLAARRAPELPQRRLDPAAGPIRQGGLMRRIPALDWMLLAAVLGLSVLGALAGLVGDLHPRRPHRRRPHGVPVEAGGQHRDRRSVLLVAVLVTDHRWVRIVAPLVYAASLVGLVLVLTMGSTVNGSRSWLMLGGLSIQPSEFAKLAVVIGMALVVAERAEGRWRGQVGLAEVALMLGDRRRAGGADHDAAGPRHDAGAVGDRLRRARRGRCPAAMAGLLLGGGVTAALAAVASGYLKDYQVDRFLAFTNPDLDPRGAGYNVEQARIAIGNGGVFGQGLFDGSQTQSGFVPEQHTDFVFTVAGEELGLVGAGVLIALPAVVIWRALVIAGRTDDVFGRVAAAGIACWFGFQAFQNIGMCLGIMPVTGVPLPFVSYGGSSMFAGMLAVGLLQNIHLRSRDRAGSTVGARERAGHGVGTRLKHPIGRMWPVLSIRVLPRRGVTLRAALATLEIMTVLVVAHTWAGGALPVGRLDRCHRGPGLRCGHGRAARPGAAVGHWCRR